MYQHKNQHVFLQAHMILMFQHQILHQSELKNQAVLCPFLNFVEGHGMMCCSGDTSMKLDTGRRSKYETGNMADGRLGYSNFVSIFSTKTFDFHQVNIAVNCVI